MAVRIVIADDHLIFRDGLVALFEKQDDIEVVGVASDGLQAVKLAGEKSPRIVILDVNMPHLNGVEAARRIKQENPEIKIIALSMHSKKSYITQMLQAGATGYLLKECPFEELLLAIKTVMMNNKYLDSQIASIIVDDYMERMSTTTSDPLSILSEREREVFHLLAEGKSAKEVSKLLYISIKTTETHRRVILEKLNLKNQIELVKFAIREKIVTL